VTFQALRPPCSTDVRLSKHTSLGVGGTADLFFSPDSVEELREDVKWLRLAGIPTRMLGGGTNVACSDNGFRGAIISTQSLSRACHEGTRIRARAGCSLASLVRKCCDLGLSGMEPLVGIPGTVGGAVVMNAGGRYGNLGSIIDEVRTLTPEGEEKVYRHPGARFGYRRGDFGSDIIVEIVIALASSSPDRVRQEMCRILREKFASQPLSARSAGCVFRNPPDDSAGRLIQACGLKGSGIGGMEISPVHANFIVNHNDGSFRDFMELARLASDSVRSRFGIELELEVCIL
jgi:UDP-N-acetylmuramate dehydrogenase